MPNYAPEKGDFIVATFDPQSGHEQKGRRPALVISNSLFNEATGLTIVCPITHTNRNIPFHIDVSEKSSLTGFIMVEQVKSIDYISRRVKFIEKADDEILNEVLSVLDACIYQNT
ncbi:type II toxin-antitoxin system PemK/MazF family toxin [Methyloprofundus sp.]|uniref:type II toxin-antitoxin system PemK/MazF family toxin n=1 Tax=Methyloprofundus sp. TaxID=2020875 RepID=UPI003D09A460